MYFQAESLIYIYIFRPFTHESLNFSRRPEPLSGNPTAMMKEDWKHRNHPNKDPNWVRPIFFSFLSWFSTWVLELPYVFYVSVDEQVICFSDKIFPDACFVHIKLFDSPLTTFWGFFFFFFFKGKIGSVQFGKHVTTKVGKMLKPIVDISSLSAEGVDHCSKGSAVYELSIKYQKLGHQYRLLSKTPSLFLVVVGLLEYGNTGKGTFPLMNSHLRLR